MGERSMLMSEILLAGGTDFGTVTVPDILKAGFSGYAGGAEGKGKDKLKVRRRQDAGDTK